MDTNSTVTGCRPCGRMVPAAGTHTNSGFLTSPPPPWGCSSSSGTRTLKRMGISLLLWMVSSFVYRYPYDTMPKSNSSTSMVNVGPTTRPRKSRESILSPPTICQSNDSENSPRTSLLSVMVTSCVWPTESTPADGSKENLRPKAEVGGTRRNSASISPRFISSTSYWCTALTKVSPTSRTSKLNTAMGPTPTPLSVSGRRSSRPSMLTKHVAADSPGPCGWNRTVTSVSPPGTTSPLKGTHVKESCSNSSGSAVSALSSPRAWVAYATAEEPRISSSPSESLSAPSCLPPPPPPPPGGPGRRSVSVNTPLTRMRASSSMYGSASFLTSKRTVWSLRLTTLKVR
mmetsp:Transcript_35694/g.87842  ORF Transcript_35694/g.87842 Transcript_35694/m.87842 type:complete len:344 (+) Transcript_35694:2206-3237(+)